MFKLNNIVFDRIVAGLILNKETANVERYLSELSTLSLEVSADPIEIQDKNGVTVYRKYQGKSLAVSATNAFISADILAMTSGSDTKYATDEASALVFPQAKTVKGTETKFTIENMIPGSLHINALTNSNTVEAAFAEDSTASATAYSVEHTDAVAGNSEEDIEPAPAKDVITLPVGSGAQNFLITYKKNVISGMAIENKSTDFPKTTELVFKTLAVDPCDHKLRACYIDIPAFMADPSVTVAINNSDASTMDFTGSAMLDYCSDDKSLFTIMFAEDDLEDGE